MPCCAPVVRVAVCIADGTWPAGEAKAEIASMAMLRPLGLMVSVNGVAPIAAHSWNAGGGFGFRRLPLAARAVSPPAPGVCFTLPLLLQRRLHLSAQPCDRPLRLYGRPPEALAPLVRIIQGGRGVARPDSHAAGKRPSHQSARRQFTYICT